jgi:hypothetical protein
MRNGENEEDVEKTFLFDIVPIPSLYLILPLQRTLAGMVASRSVLDCYCYQMYG